MSSWTLADIRRKVRQVTGRFGTNELTNSQIDDYINKYYQFTFPAEVKLEREHTYYEFLTTPYQATYDLPTGYTNFEPPAAINFYSLYWYQDPAVFFENNPLQVTQLDEWTGDGTTVTFSATVVSYPIYPGYTVITDNVEVFQDTNTTWTTSNVSIVGDQGGSATVNYNSGAISVTFATAPADGQVIYLTYVAFQAGRPTSVLMYNNQFEFYPPPDTAYSFRIKAYAIVAALVNGTDTPPYDQWGPCIAYGAARDILSDNGEYDAYAEVTALYREQVNYVMTRTEQTLLNTRAYPNF